MIPPLGSVRVEAVRDADSSTEEAGKPDVGLGEVRATESVIVPVGGPEPEGELEPDPFSDGEMEPESVPVDAMMESEPEPKPSPDSGTETEAVDEPAATREVGATESLTGPVDEPESGVAPEPERDADRVVESEKESPPGPDAKSVTDASSETELLGVWRPTSSVDEKVGSVTRTAVVATLMKEDAFDVGTKSSVNAVSLLAPDGDAEEDEPPSGPLK